MSNLKRSLMVAGLFISGSIVLTACNTVKGTVHGASRDINNVVQAVDHPAPKQRVVTKRTTHTHVATKKKVETNNSVAQKTTVKTSVHNNAQQVQHGTTPPASTTTTTTTTNTSN